MNTLYISIQDVIKELGQEATKCRLNNTIVYIAEQKTGFGYKKFFLCPLCNERITKLYLYTRNKEDCFICRHCYPINIYKGIQNVSPGSDDYIRYKMKRLANKYNLKFSFPFDYRYHLLDRPKYMRVEKYRTLLRNMQVLESMRIQAIYFNRKYDSKLIERVLNSPFIEHYALQDIQRYNINWYKTIEREKEYAGTLEYNKVIKL